MTLCVLWGPPHVPPSPSTLPQGACISHEVSPAHVAKLSHDNFTSRCPPSRIVVSLAPRLAGIERPTRHSLDNCNCFLGKVISSDRLLPSNNGHCVGVVSVSKKHDTVITRLEDSTPSADCSPINILGRAIHYH